MKIEIDDSVFAKIAIELNIDPGILFKKILQNIARFPRYAINEVINKHCSLDEMLTSMIENSELGYVFNHLVKKTMGNYRYVVNHSDYSINDELIWADIDLVRQDFDCGIASIHVQYGSFPMIIVTDYVDDTKVDVSFDKLEEEIYDKIDSFPAVDEAKDFEIDIKEFENSISYSLQIDSSQMFGLPKLSDVEDVMLYIKEIILSHQQTQLQIKK